MDNAMQSMSDLALSQTALPRAQATMANTSIDKAAEDFTAVFFSQMLEPMFDGVGTDPMFGGGHGEEVMKSFLVQEYGKIAAKQGFGLTTAVKDAMLKAQANAQSQRAVPRGGAYAAAQ